MVRSGGEALTAENTKAARCRHPAVSVEFASPVDAGAVTELTELLRTWMGWCRLLCPPSLVPLLLEIGGAGCREGLQQCQLPAAPGGPDEGV